MKYTDVVKRSGQMVWRYRALWLFGALLALTVGSTLPLWPVRDHETDVSQIPVRLTRQATLYLPGSGVRIDLVPPGGFFVESGDGRWTNLATLRDAREWLRSAGLDWPTGTWRRDVWAVLGVAAAVLLVCVGLCTVARYVSETALIRMVSETEDTGKKLSVRQGLRRGFARPAWRLFLIDLALYSPAVVGLALLFALALSPLLLWLTQSVAVGVGGSILAAGLLVLFSITCLAVWLLLSVLLPLARRACAVDGLGVRASIRRGVAVVRTSFGAVASIWLTWAGTRLVWAIAMIPVAVLLLPALLLALLTGGVAGGLLAVALGGLLSLFWTGLAPWIVGILVGLPILLLALGVPMAFAQGLVEIFLSGMWTLGYRDLRPARAEEAEPVPQSATLVAAPQGL